MADKFATIPKDSRGLRQHQACFPNDIFNIGVTMSEQDLAGDMFHRCYTGLSDVQMN